mmetsp:Transcript_6599/g.14619  ORF Transcript_6599/g.14619 Transcript_6599/m.14619 type:complete len:281 (-) Transcript_6599:555-1397(-)
MGSLWSGRERENAPTLALGINISTSALGENASGGGDLLPYSPPSPSSQSSSMIPLVCLDTLLSLLTLLRNCSQSSKVILRSGRFRRTTTVRSPSANTLKSLAHAFRPPSTSASAIPFIDSITSPALRGDADPSTLARTTQLPSPEDRRISTPSGPGGRDSSTRRPTRTGSSHAAPANSRRNARTWPASARGSMDAPPMATSRPRTTSGPSLPETAAARRRSIVAFMRTSYPITAQKFLALPVPAAMLLPSSFSSGPKNDDPLPRPMRVELTKKCRGRKPS